MRGLILSSKENESIEPMIRRAMADAGFETIRPDASISPGALWASAIEDAIHTADFVVADLSQQNPNVMLELGYALAYRKPTILLARRGAASRMPSDLAGAEFVLYDPDDRSGLTRRLRSLSILTSSPAPASGH